ncbi:ribonuclease-3 [Cryobacterium mesophilum]|uniref:Ribonuclease 3 n=1 Tax=Terrimesophilobacter mesophilus TaxID=433647 RepID=A0A4R8V872_9MICO|nr:ribonuclease III [Terrimesophilobacter mesophilus]MBB5632516.1 ribonuclease-3 [Terrimesophilobacter mesophilus]TFB79341.1 ribonuclease III [Terrimesophilobacter mesophilus]
MTGSTGDGLSPVPDARELADALGVPLSPALLELALVHRSYAYENGGLAHNERLEFLGDSILGQAVTVMLYTENPTLDEGELAKRRASLVSSVALAEVARRIGLGQYIRLGKGEEQTGGREKSSILADTVEAVIGAVYLDAGPDVATDLVLRLIRPLMDNPDRFGAAMDPKTSLQELAAALGKGLPHYEVTDSGPDHSKRFHATVIVGTDPIASGHGSSKKHAEMAAALSAWTLLQDGADEVAVADVVELADSDARHLAPADSGDPDAASSSL